MTAAASESPSAHYSAYQGLGCDGSGIKLRTPDAFQHRGVDPQALLGQMVEVWALKQLLGWLSVSMWSCLEHLRSKVAGNLIPPWIRFTAALLWVSF